MADEKPTTWRGMPLDWSAECLWNGMPRVGGLEQRERKFRWSRLAWWWCRPVYRAHSFHCWTDGYVWECPCS